MVKTRIFFQKIPNWPPLIATKKLIYRFAQFIKTPSRNLWCPIKHKSLMPDQNLKLHLINITVPLHLCCSFVSFPLRAQFVFVLAELLHIWQGKNIEHKSSGPGKKRRAGLYLADCPAMSFVLVCWHIKIQMQILLSWAINYAAMYFTPLSPSYNTMHCHG